MEQHPIPRQITTFEFKLIGFLTIKQFVYLIVCASSTVTLYFLIPIPIINLITAALTVILGLVIVFVPFNERPLDMWIANFIKRLISPLQYYYFKKNQPPKFLEDVFIPSPPKIIEAHLDARQKLTSYMTKDVSIDEEEKRKQNIHDLLYRGGQEVKKETMPDMRAQEESTPQDKKTTNPFLFGVVRNNQSTPLPNILIYITDKNNITQRILKTNNRGVFATFYPLPSDKYFLNIKDPGEKYFFDKIDVGIAQTNPLPVNIVSRELL